MLTGPIANDLIKLAPRIAGCSSSEADTLLRLAVPSLAALLSSAEIATLLHDYMEDARLGRAVPIEDGKQGEIVLHRDEYTFISLATYEQPAKVLHTHAVRGLFQVLGGEPFEVRRFRLPVGWDPSDPPAASRLTPAGSFVVRPGDHVTIDGTQEVAWFGYRSEVAVFKYIVPMRAHQTWAFDPRTLALLDPECADPQLDALVHAADLVRDIQSPSSLPGLAVAAGHPAYFVRWAALKAAAAIDRYRGMELLEKAVHDEHRLVRAAAARALAQQAE